MATTAVKQYENFVILLKSTIGLLPILSVNAFGATKIRICLA